MCILYWPCIMKMLKFFWMLLLSLIRKIMNKLKYDFALWVLYGVGSLHSSCWSHRIEWIAKLGNPDALLTISSWSRLLVLNCMEFFIVCTLKPYFDVFLTIINPFGVKSVTHGAFFNETSLMTYTKKTQINKYFKDQKN